MPDDSHEIKSKFLDHQINEIYMFSALIGPSILAYLNRLSSLTCRSTADAVLERVLEFVEVRLLAFVCACLCAWNMPRHVSRR